MLRQLVLVILCIAAFVAIAPFYVASMIPNKSPEVEVFQEMEAFQSETKLKTLATATVIEPPRPAMVIHIIGQAAVPNSRDSSGQNAILAARLVNGVIIQPGEVFSFNQIVGIRTPSRGFLDGQTVVNTVYGSEYVMGIGGGICRTSTVIHHAVLAAGLEVVERHNHSLPVSYSELGRDAAVAYGALDYRFKNNTDMPVKVLVNADNTRVAVKLLTIAGAQENKNQE